MPIFTFDSRQKQIDKLKNRVKELEEKLCPGENHQWVCREIEPYDYGMSNRKYVCQRCGKVQWRMF